MAGGTQGGARDVGGGNRRRVAYRASHTGFPGNQVRRNRASRSPAAGRRLRRCHTGGRRPFGTGDRPGQDHRQRVFTANFVSSGSFLEFVKKANEAGKGQFKIQVRGGTEAIGGMEQAPAARKNGGRELLNQIWLGRFTIASRRHHSMDFMLS